MKGILQFDLPEDQEDWEFHQSVYRMAALIDEMQSYLKTNYKHTEPNERPKFQEIYEHWSNLRASHDC